MGLVERLLSSRKEIEEAILARVYGVADPAETGDPTYVTGLREAVSAAVEYGLTAAGHTSDESTPIPVVLLAQARYAAQSGVGLEVVLRRYLAGYVLIGDFLLEIAGRDGLPESAELRRAWRRLAVRFDRLLEAVTDAYDQPRQGRGDPEERRGEQVRKLLGAELLEPVELGYELDTWHLAAIATGPGAEAAIRELAFAADRRLLSVHARAGEIWAWLGGQRKIGAEEVLALAIGGCPAEVALALGEPAEGIAGWRLSHRQASVAIEIAQRSHPSQVRYAEVALLASALADDLLAASLRESYLAPLEADRDGGVALRKTLRAYFAAARSITSCAAALGAGRQTVRNRLALVEEMIGMPLEACAAELETALRLLELEEGPSRNVS